MTLSEALARMTVAQFFLVINSAIALAAALALGVFHTDPTITGSISGAVTVFVNSIGAALTSPAAQTRAVAANIEDPATKVAMVDAVSKIKGLDPLQVNQNADEALRKLAADPNVAKVLPPT